MTSVQRISVLGFAAALAMAAPVARAQDATPTLPVIALTEDQPIVTMSVPVPPARPVVGEYRPAKKAAVARAPAHRAKPVVARSEPAAAPQLTKVAYVKTFWLTVGTGF